MNNKGNENDGLISADSMTGFSIRDANSSYEVVVVLHKIRTHW